MIRKIEIKDRKTLYSILKNCKYDRVLIDSILEGNNGYSDAIIINNVIKTVRLDSGSFTILAGDCNETEVNSLLDLRPIYIITPQSVVWDNLLKNKFKKRLETLKFVEYNYNAINIKRLKILISNIPNDYLIKEFDLELANKAEVDLHNEYLFENFHSKKDFLINGLGYCILHNGLVVSAATSMAKSSTAIDIEIETHKEYRKKGLATVVGAALVLKCIENNLNPMWLAANKASEALAKKIGYIKASEYISYSVKDD